MPVGRMLTLQLQILNSLTKAASDYANLYSDLMTGYQAKPEEGRSWYRPPPQDPFSTGWPFMQMPNGFAFSPFYAFAMLGPLAWQNPSISHNAMFAGPLAMMNFWSQVWGLTPTDKGTAYSATPMSPWGFGDASQSALAPGYGLIKMSITFPDDTEIKFAFPGPPVR